MNPRRCLTSLLPALASFTVAHAAAGPITSHQAPYPTVGEIERLDPALDHLLAPDAKLEKLAEGFNWSEGPVWVPKENSLLFSDTKEGIAYRWRAADGITVFLNPSGFTGEHYDGREPGSNGLTLDPQGRVVLAQHGDRRIARLNPDGKTFTTVADRYDGKRFNSPNDLCYDRRGNLYFTDPPYGVGPSTKIELDFQGIFRVSPDGKVTLLSKELARPNGIGLSPDERTLYVGNSDSARPVILAFDLRSDGTVGPSRVFFDAKPLNAQGRRGALDGMDVDAEGNLWTTGPGGVLILSPAGKLLGAIHPGMANANTAFGGDDGTTLYITAGAALLRIKTKVRGAAY